MFPPYKCSDNFPPGWVDAQNDEALDAFRFIFKYGCMARKSSREIIKKKQEKNATTLKKERKLKRKYQKERVGRRDAQVTHK